MISNTKGLLQGIIVIVVIGLLANSCTNTRQQKLFEKSCKKDNGTVIQLYDNTVCEDVNGKIVDVLK